jgi:hypothetical protein
MSRPTILALLSVVILAAHARAQEVTYQRDITFPTNLPAALSTVHDPLNQFSDPQISDPNSHTLTATAGGANVFYVYSSTGTTSGNQPLTRNLFLDENSFLASSGTNEYFVNSLGQLVTFDLRTRLIASNPFMATIGAVSSLAVSGSTPSYAMVIGEDNGANFGGFTVDLQTGAATKVFSTDGTGLLSATSYYQNYGADGLLYVLDYGNTRMEVLDPANSFGSVRAFTLATTGTQSAVANMQFTIAADGSIFLGDGVGGGFMYSSTGTLLDQFTLSAGSYDDPFVNGIHPYLDYTPDGHVFVFDTTGAHEYAVSPVPEPSTVWLLCAGLLAAGATVIQRLGRRARC